MRLAICLACALASPVVAEPVLLPLTPQTIDQTFCLDALSDGQVIAVQPDGSLLIQYGALFYFIAITPATITCEASRYIPK